MSARGFTRKLIDPKGTIWAVEVPVDVDPENLKEIVSAAKEGIAKLQGYLLPGEEQYRLPADNSEIPNGKRQFAFYKKMEVVFGKDKGSIKQDDFSAAMDHLVAEARKSKINKVRLTEYEGKPVVHDPKSGGYYLESSVPCKICEKEIKGKRRLSMSEGHFTRPQQFEPYDEGVVRYRPGSRLRVCAECAPKQIEPPPPEEAATEQPEHEAAPPEETVTKRESAMELLLRLSSHYCGVDPLYFKGLVHGILLSQG